MTNIKINKSGDPCKDDVYINDRTNSSETELDVARESDTSQFIDSAENDSSAGNVDGFRYINGNFAEDADEINNYSGTSTSFSLQECMSEFRARRIRRSSLSQHIQDICINGDSKNVQGMDELDLIKQNMCNKEQERKCKPCQNGFCYCFTSDSGDGGGNMVGCYLSESSPAFNSRRSKQLKCIQFSNAGKRIGGRSQCRREIREIGETNCLKRTPHTIKAMSSLETSTRVAPLIHIIQELRNNCVISKVNVNKHKIKSFGNNIIFDKKTSDTTKAFKYKTKAEKPTCLQRKSFDSLVSDKYSPTAPILKKCLDLENVVEVKKCSDHIKRKCNAKGQLLQKRLSISHIDYKTRGKNQAPPKPPRTHTHINKYFETSTSTSSSVREAEKVIDNFFASNGVKEVVEAAINKSMITAYYSKNTKKVENVKRNSYPLTSNENKTQTGNYIFTCPSLSDMEKINKSKKVTDYNKETKQVADKLIQALNLGWNETKINDMLNCNENINMKCRESCSNSVHAQPQQIPSNDLAKCEKSYGWKMLHKINLDTVDGNVHRKLASNFEDKNSLAKTKITSLSPITSISTTRGEPPRPKFLWFEQLRNLSPWSNKCNKNGAERYRKDFKCTSKAKEKLVSLVSPKKDNKDQKYVQVSKSSYRDVGVQTSHISLSCSPANMHKQYQHFSSPQSPPGSYHSPIQFSHLHYPSTQSQNTTLNETEAKFDFSRTVRSPPKKAARASQRKLNFPFNCSFTCKDEDRQNRKFSRSTEDQNQQKTYRSFNLELDQDVSTSKISYILSEIRAKLETNDQQATRTFLETHSNTYGSSIDDLCLKSNQNNRTEERFEENKYTLPSGTRNESFHDPVYSEIENDSFYIVESADNQNHSGIQHFVSANNPDILYAKVNKYNKIILDTEEFKFHDHIPLAKIMHDSIKGKRAKTNLIPLPILPEPSGSESTSYFLPLSSALTHCQSLNNVRVMEHNSSPKKQRNLSKSDLSLNRSEIFLENLCKSDLVVRVAIDVENVEKLQNDIKNISNHSYVPMVQPCFNDVLSSISNQQTNYDDTVSYKLPNNKEVDVFNKLVDIGNSTNDGSNLALNTIVPPSANNQSTPKKQSFVTKDKSITCELDVNTEATDIIEHIYSTFPVIPHRESDKFITDQYNLSLFPILNDEYKYEVIEKSNIRTGLKRYKSLINMLNKSFRKSKNFINKGEKQLSTSMNNAIEATTKDSSKRIYTDSNLNLEFLFSPNDTATINDQIAQTVSICRKLPNFEVSMEMVEAERLLLYSALRQDLTSSPAATKTNIMCQNQRTHFFIDDIFLPVLANNTQEMIFKYFYIITFECGGVIKSTQSVECVNNTAVFRDSGIEFVYCSNSKLDTLEEASRNAVKCNIFLLRLRKLCTVSSELTENTIMETLPQTPPSILKSTSSSFSEVVSRFRLCASFTLDAKDFAPYEYIHQESKNSQFLCVKASSFCTLPLTNRIKSTHLTTQLRLKGRTELQVQKCMFSGFLNVQDAYKQHNWNRRWCTLDGIFLYVWQDENCFNTSPLIAIDLRDSKRNINYPLTCLPRDQCARLRSFCLECKINGPCDDISNVTIFFAADTHENMSDWLKNLNVVLDFIAKWL